MADVPLMANPMTTQDDIIVGGASGVAGRLGKGTDGQVLTVDPSTHHLVWADPSGGVADILDLTTAETDDTLVLAPDGAGGVEFRAETGGGGGGGLTFLEAHTASSSATLDFTSFISGTYDDYLIEIVNIIPATNNVSLRMQLSSNGGSSYNSTSNYYSAVVYVLNAGTSGGAATGNPTTAFILGDGLSNSSSRGVSASIRLLSPGSTALDKPLYGTIQYTNQASVVGATYSGLLTVAGTAFNAAQFAMSSGNIASGTIRIYGLSKS